MTTGSLREYCRRQDWNPGYGHKLKSAGRLVMVMQDGKELVDFEASDARMASTSDPAKHHMAEVNDRQRAMHRGTIAPPSIDRAMPDSGGSKNATYMQAKTAREVYEAKNAQLEYEERVGKLVRADEVKSHLASKIAAMREAFLQIPSRLVPVLAAESDPAKIHTVLEAEIIRAMALVSGEGNYGSA